MDDENLPILYSFRRCPYAMRARLALWASGKTIILREIALAAKPEAMLEASAKGTVPVLVLDRGLVIEESLDIMLWALMANDPSQWMPANPFQAIQLIKRNDEEFKPWLDRYKYPERFAKAEDARSQGLTFLITLEEHLTVNGGSYLCRQTPSLADMAIFPFIRQFARVDQEWFDSLGLPNLKAWLLNLMGSEEFLAIMKKFEPWKPEHDPTLWGRLQ